MIGRFSLGEVGDILSNRTYMGYMTGNFLSQSGEWAQRLAVGWLAWEYTKSPFWLGMILFADLAPTILISPLSGALLDRMDRLQLTRWTVWASLVQPIFLSALYFTDLLDIWFLLGATFYLGIVHSLNQAARFSIIPLLVEEKDVHRATPFGSISFNLARFTGPMLFGLIVLVAPAGYAFLVNILCYVAFILFLRKVTLRDEALAPHRGRNLFAAAKDGIAYALTHPGIGPLLIVLIASSFGTRAFMDLLPGFADQVFGRGPEALSMMTSITALGALIGAVYLVMRSSITGLASVAMAASMLTGLGLILFTASDHYYLGLVILFLVGIGLSVSAVGVLSLVQVAVRGEMRGRVVAFYGIIFRGGPAIGGLVMGWIAESTGLRWPVAGGGLLCVIAWFWVAGRLGEVRRALESGIGEGGAK
ncbi:MAG: MFS transporter [Alphaproteobacteria bacterium]|nr:MFS transporter [Alphaproteobacteria bacterium]